MNSLVTRTAAQAALIASLLVGGTAFAAVPASAATADEPDLTGLSCGFDNRTPPPTVQAGSKGRTVREAQCLLNFWTGLQMTEEEPEGVFGLDAASATRHFQAVRGLPLTGAVDAATWGELRHS
ncbi:peptidoglycan-binding protein [Streptomyces sp. NPDC060028]|uniref:peptidoglycan-binding domain-containing protein n=1 Tax=Streptomyces sp. NPDC060028 TaxID=3347041 RepID=UPI00369A8233